MHEIGVLSEIVKTVERIAEENQGRQVTAVTLEIGELSGYLPQFFQQYFPIMVEGSLFCREAKLQISIIKGQAICRECQTMYNVLQQEGKCPLCKSTNKKILGGIDLKIKSVCIEVYEAEV